MRLPSLQTRHPASRSTLPLLCLLCLLLGLSGRAPKALSLSTHQAAASTPHAPAILAKSAYLLDISSGEALFQKFPTARRPMASTTKLMTGLLTAESGRLDELATVSRAAASVGETTMGLVEGEQVPVGELLHGLLMNSGNDAAIVLADHLAGSVPAFTARMNARAESLGLTDTHFANPHGLDNGVFYSPQQYASARDLATLLAVAMDNPSFARAAGTLRREVLGPPGAEPHRLRHTVSALWWYPGALAGKTGWTGRAGQVRVVMAERAGMRLVSVVMDSPDDVGETRDLLDYGFAISGRFEAQRSVPLTQEAFATPDTRLVQAWSAYKQVALSPDGRIRRGAAGDETTSDAQAAALLHAVWFRDRTAFDSIWSWTKSALSRQRNPSRISRDALFASRWARGSVGDWSNSTAADQRLAAALLLASRLWNEPRYRIEAKPILDAVLNDAAISWPGSLGVPSANAFLKDLEPTTTSAATLTPAFYRMFAEGGRHSVWLWLLDGTYAVLEQATARAGPLGPGAGLLPSWFSVSRSNGQLGDPIDPAWQSTGFGPESAALVWQLALDAKWSGDPRPRALLAPSANVLAGDLVQRQRLAATYARGGAVRDATESATYGALAGLLSVVSDPRAEQLLRGKLKAAIESKDPDRILDGIDGLWLLAGGPPNYWRIWWPPEDLPTSRNDSVVPPLEPQDSTWRYFNETGHVVQDRFFEFFTRNGGVGTFGLPRTDQFVEDGRTVQYFQRARLDLYPEREGTGAEVVVPASVGIRTAQARDILSRPEARPIPAFESDDKRLFVPETNHSLSAGFRAFYEQHGGPTVLGYPITEELNEDGFTVQYFERAVLEYQPGKPVQPALVADDLLRQRDWLK
jgi:D-alanyl-D-alanine carboxypeptidase